MKEAALESLCFVCIETSLTIKCCDSDVSYSLSFEWDMNHDGRSLCAVEA